MSYIHAIEQKDDIVCWSRKNGILDVTYYPSSDYYYLFIPDNKGDGQYTNIYGDRMRKVDFDNRWDMLDFAKSHVNVCESDVPVINKFLIDEYPDADINEKVNVLFYDIEIDFDLSEGRGYPKPNNPYGEINAISSFDVTNQKYILYLHSSFKNKFKISDKQFPVEHVYFNSEHDLLRTFADNLEDIDVLAGWFTAGFDLPYIMERSIMLFGEETAKSMFCRDGYKAHKRTFFNDTGEEVWEWTLAGRIHLDMMALYKKFNPGELKSFSLDSVCEHELKMNKIDYDGDLGELYRTDPETFFKYSLHDTRLLYELDNKLAMINLAMMMARSSCVFPFDVTGSVKPIEHGFIKFCRSKGNIVLPDKIDHDKEDFPGAIVYDTIEGRHGWLMSIDLTALYPSVMIMLGLSTETLVGQCIGGYVDYVAVMDKKDDTVSFVVEETKEVFDISAIELYNLIKENGYCISANGTVFDGRLGLLSEYVKNVFETRKKYKKMMFQYEKDGNKDMAKMCDMYQKVYKIFANSLYGSISNQYFRLFDIRLAKSITLTGQVISKWQAYKCNEILNEVKNV